MNIPVFEQHSIHLNSCQNIQSSSPAQPGSTSDLHLSEFKDNVQVSKEKLVELVDKGIFAQQTQEFNRKAVDIAYEGYYPEAGVLLGQAQKILQYAANRGKQINRNLIVTVLHNSAFCYQQNRQFQKCSNYIQALIYNLNCQIRQQEGAGTDQGFIVTDNMQLRSQLTHYYLLYCAISSQLRQNDGALIAAKRANSLLKANSSILYKLATKSRIQVDESTFLLLKELSNLQCSAQNITIEQLLNATYRFFHIWQNKCKFPNHELKNLINRMTRFSIGNIMQMEPLDYVQDKHFNIDFRYEQMLQRVINISVSYFTMATQLRLLAFKFTASKLQGQKTSQYRESQCYHLFAIILILYYFPFEMLYLRHIMASFKTHYHIDIENSEPSNYLSQLTPQQHFYNIFFTRYKDDEIKGSTANNSQKQTSSGRNSDQEGKSSYLNKLESYVRASLKKHHHFQHSKDMAKLNNYYYVKGEMQQSRQKASKKSNRSSHKDLRSFRKKVFLTSKHSTNKTPINYKSNEGSPKRRSKCSSKSSKIGSKRGSMEQTIIGKIKKSPVLEQYFETERSKSKKQKKCRSKSKKRTSSSKQNNYLTFPKEKQVISSQNTWKATNITNRQNGPHLKNRQNVDILTFKSTSRNKGKLSEVRSKKKIIHYK